MKSLELQLVEDKEDLDNSYFLQASIEALGIDERGGGPEGLYYTHPTLDGEYLRRNLSNLVKDLLLKKASFIHVNSKR